MIPTAYDFGRNVKEERGWDSLLCSYSGCQAISDTLSPVSTAFVLSPPPWQGLLLVQTLSRWSITLLSLEARDPCYRDLTRLSLLPLPIYS